ncbi:hypothetical protein [Metallosphaera hakonensis]|uniref:hypothetical protein n=1 Tax=Metallosphaera hakonensis TaxID=79601 RepID=UPI000A5370F6|nr:hypothetical protein [Metallosphaera hakonensis]
MEVKSKRHLRIRGPFDCEKGLPYTEIQNGDKRIENCTPISPERTGLGLRLSNLALHKIKLVRRVPWILERISRNMNVPDSYPAEEELKEEKLKMDTLIIGSGLSGLFALNRTNGLLVTNELFTDIFDDPTNTNGELLHKSKEIIKSNAERIISGDFLGKFSEGYLVRTKGKIIMISPSRIVFAVGARYLPPIFEGNDYPNVISRRLYLKRISNYKKVIVLGSFDDAIKTALLSNAKILTPRGVRLFSKKVY